MWKVGLCSCQFERISPVGTTTLSFSGVSLCLGKSMHTAGTQQLHGECQGSLLRIIVEGTSYEDRSGCQDWTSFVIQSWSVCCCHDHHQYLYHYCATSTANITTITTATTTITATSSTTLHSYHIVLNRLMCSGPADWGLVSSGLPAQKTWRDDWAGCCNCEREEW